LLKECAASNKQTGPRQDHEIVPQDNALESVHTVLKTLLRYTSEIVENEETSPSLMVVQNYIFISKAVTYYVYYFRSLHQRKLVIRTMSLEMEPRAT
jgi:hypothetical protein